MSFRLIQKNSTDQSVIIRIINSTSGLPETGVTFESAGIDLWYRRDGAAVVSITEATLAAVNSAHSDGGIIHIGNGYYRLDLPDAAVATGVNGVMVGGTVTGMIVIGCYVPLVSYNPYDAVRLGLTALPNAAADAAGGLPISDAGGLDLDSIKTMQGTDKKCLISTDAQTLTSLKTNLVDAPNATAITAFVTAIFAKTGITAAGTWTYAKIIKVIAAWASGKWQDKAGVPGTYEILDAEGGATKILEVTPSTTSPQKTTVVS